MTKKYKLQDVMDFLKERYLDTWQMFNSRNICGDPMENEYNKDSVRIDVCYYYEYIEIFGLTEEDFKKIAPTFDLD